MGQNITSDLEKFSEDLQQLMNAHDFNQCPSDTIYHYTSWNGLHGILSSKELWFTNYQHTNDPTEIMFSMECIEESLRELKPDIDKKSLPFLDDFLSKFRELFNEFSIYIFSFCKVRDSMPLWRYYANNGVGFSIGFNKKFFHEDKEFKFADVDCAVQVKIQYDKKKYNAFIKESFKKSNDIFLKKIGNGRPDYDFFKNLTNEIYSRLASHLIPSMVATKNKAFKDEKEFRIYRPEWMDYKIPPNEKFFPKKIQMNGCFANDQHSCISRVKTKFNLDAVKEIMIGPACNIIYAKSKIEELLSSIGHEELPISFSKWKYR